MGPRSIERGRWGSAYYPTSLRQMLQWGRVQSNAEGRHNPFPQISTSIASMGPRSIERGRPRHALFPAEPIAELQWGRVQSNAEGSRRGRGLARILRFNGAAFNRT